MRDPTYLEAARTALDGAMALDDRIVVLGEDVGAGGPFGLTKGLESSFGQQRVRNTPISEGAVMGAGIGLALGGRRPFVDLMFNDFLTLASDQLFNHAAKIHFMSGGRYSVPLTVWSTAGGLTRWGAQHSQRLDGWFAQVPGLKVLAPATPAAAGAAVTASLEDPDPVVILADRACLYQRDALPGDDRSPWSARVVREGSAATIATVGRLVRLAIGAAEASGIDAEVVDLQRLAPLDVGPVVDSIARTGRLLVVHDEPRCGSMSAAIAAAVGEAGAAHLAAPVRRLTSPDTPVPAAASLEDDYAISVEEIARALALLVDEDFDRQQNASPGGTRE